MTARWVWAVCALIMWAGWISGMLVLGVPRSLPDKFACAALYASAVGFSFAWLLRIGVRS